ncbi:hypothetical protein QP164_04860 [Sphingomonas sp. LR59]|uniref:hypothetical protein n=1 Tax=Sphingomonas sp. LR59 TaxID=3050232 RepID=UPI002FDF109C
MNTCLMASAVTAMALMTTGPVAAQEKPGFKDTPMLPGGQWRVHDADRPAPIVVAPAATPAVRLPMRSCCSTGARSMRGSRTGLPGRSITAS